jgi:caffeoyl-CoA O-methyltransferase
VTREPKSSLSEEALAYLAAHTRQDEVLARVERETAGMPRSAMQVSPDQGALLELLARLTRATNALEVGTFTGYSAICIARGLADGGRLTCLEVDEEYAEIARRNLDAAGVADRVSLILGPAAQTLEKTPAEPVYDYVFLDADKTGYDDYYELILPRLTTNGLLLIDNVLMGGGVLEDEMGESSQAIDALNAKLVDDERVDVAFAFVADGLAFVRKR